MRTKTRKERMAEFVEYHNHGDGECNNVVLKCYAQQERLTAEQKFALCYYFATTYCVPAAIYMLEQDSAIKAAPERWARENKSRIIFQSDRRHVQRLNRFEIALADFTASRNETAQRLEDCIAEGVLDLTRAIPLIEEWYYYKRFSAFLFLETWVEMRGIKVQNASIDWKHGDTATSGMLNLFAYDTEADLFDKTGKLLLEPETMDKLLQTTTAFLERSGGDGNVTKIETSLCAYRKFYKGTRYNGYYLDRMLEELEHYQTDPDFGEIISAVKGIRKQQFKARYLGEVMGWTGIRKECKEIYKETGRMI